jgi:hypothetical protein
VKEELAGLHLTQESLKSSWEGVMRTIDEDKFATSAAKSAFASRANMLRKVKK